MPWPSITDSAIFDGEQPNGAQRIVVAGDDVVDDVRIAVRVHDRDHRNAQPPRFGDGDLFVLGIDDENRIGQAAAYS